MGQYGPWSKPYYERVPPTAGDQQHGATFSRTVPQWVTDIGHHTNDRNYDGQVVTRYRQRKIGRAMNRAIRQDD